LKRDLAGDDCDSVHRESVVRVEEVAEHVEDEECCMLLWLLLRLSKININS